MDLGTSTALKPESGCACMNPKADGTIAADCNCLYMPYLDGASFAGYRAEPWPVPGSEPAAALHFRGIKNLDATLEWARDS